MDDMQEGEFDEVQRDEPEDEFDGGQGNEFFIQNVSVIDHDRYFEAVRAKGKTTKNRVIVVLSVLLIPMGLLMYQWVICLCGLIIFCLASFSSLIVGHRDYKHLKEKHPTGNWSKTIRFYSDRIEADSGDSFVSVAYYKDIKRVMQNGQMAVLDFGKKAPAMLLCKDGFTDCSYDLFSVFLREKQVQDKQADRVRNTEGSSFFGRLFRTSDAG